MMDSKPNVDASAQGPHRRAFFSQSAVLTGGLALAVGTSGKASNRKRPLGLAIIGDDEALLRAVRGHPQVRVVEMCQSSLASIRRVEKAAGKRGLPVPRHGGDWKQAVSSADCEAVVIALFSGTASRVVDSVLESGKPVLVAAPVDLAQCSERAAFCQVYLPHRSMAGVQQAIDYLHKGGLGSISEARILLAGPASLGRLNQQGRQLAGWLDLALWALQGQQVQRVMTKGKKGQLFQGEIVLDAGAVHIEHLSKSTAPVAGVREGVVIKAERGTVSLFGDDSAVAVLNSGQITRVFKGSGDALAGFLRSARNERAGTPAGPTYQLASQCWYRLAEALRKI